MLKLLIFIVISSISGFLMGASGTDLKTNVEPDCYHRAAVRFNHDPVFYKKAILIWHERIRLKLEAAKLEIHALKKKSHNPGKWLYFIDVDGVALDFISYDQDVVLKDDQGDEYPFFTSPAIPPVLDFCWFLAKADPDNNVIIYHTSRVNKASPDDKQEHVCDATLNNLVAAGFPHAKSSNLVCLPVETKLKYHQQAEEQALGFTDPDQQQKYYNEILKDLIGKWKESTRKQRAAELKAAVGATADDQDSNFQTECIGVRILVPGFAEVLQELLKEQQEETDENDEDEGDSDEIGGSAELDNTLERLFEFADQVDEGDEQEEEM